jgi:beta-N-acetylhexosaminidase
VGFPGHEPTADLKALIRDYGVGGVILFARNVAAPDQLAELVRELQGLARAAGQSLPLLVAVDQEGGRVARLREPWTVWPPLRSLGDLDSEEHARRFGGALAAELKACGINLDCAPVLDVLTNPRNTVIGDRALGDEPGRVARLGSALVQGLQEAGVAACGKHFPGHGDTAADSHHELPVVGHGPRRLEDCELVPFRAAIAAGVACLMTAHILLPELDPKLPASLSPRIVSGLLRGSLGFSGVVLSDDLEMKAIAGHFGIGQAARLAVAAGCDIVLVCEKADAQVEAAEGLVRLMEADELGMDERDLASDRIRRLKERFTLPYADPNPRDAVAAAGARGHRALAEQIAGRGATRA